MLIPVKQKTTPSTTPNLSPAHTPINSLKNKLALQKRQRSLSHDATEPSSEKKIKSKPNFNTGEHVCPVSKEQTEKGLTQTRKIKDLKYLLNFKEVNSKDVENNQTSQMLESQ